MTAMELRKQARELRAQGKSIGEIADDLNVPKVTVYSWIPTDKERREGAFEKMAGMREQGMSNVEIAKALDVSRQRVSAVLGPTDRRREPDPRRRIVVRASDDQYSAVKRRMRELGIRFTREGVQRRPAPINILLEEIAAGRLQIEWAPGHGPFTYLLEDQPGK